MKDTNIEMWFKVIDEHGTVYRIRPNPDVPNGFAGGAFIGWEDSGVNPDKNEIYISPDVLRDIAKVFNLAADEAEELDPDGALSKP
jgi:hypothetical protein